MADPTTYQRRPGTLHRHLMDGVLLLAPDAPQAVALLGTAAALWEELDEPGAVERIVDALATRFDGPPAVIEADVRATLGRLVEDGLVEACP